MKKLILLLLFSIAVQAQIKKPKDSIKQVLNAKIEIDGHLTKKEIFFKATLEGIEIYDHDKKQYKLRKCSLKDCDIIHLIEKNETLLNVIYNRYLPHQFAPYTITPTGT